MVNFCFYSNWLERIGVGSVSCSNSFIACINAKLNFNNIYKPYIGKNSSESKLVNVGRVTAATALVIAVILAPLLGSVPQMFQYIQEYTGLVSPGVLAVFIMGLFWKKTTNKAAIIGIILSIVVAFLLKSSAVNIPFLDQMLYTLLITMVIIAGVSMTTSPEVDDPKGIELTSKLFVTDSVFNISAYAILIMLVVLYTIFW